MRAVCFVCLCPTDAGQIVAMNPIEDFILKKTHVVAANQRSVRMDHPSDWNTTAAIMYEK